MVQTYEGYFVEDGRFIPDGALVKLPLRRRAIVNIFDDEVANDKETIQTDASLQERVERISLIIAAALEVENDVMTDDDWNEMFSLRSQTNAGLSRAVEI